MLKDKIVNGLSIATLLSGYFVYEKIQSIDPNYSLIAMIGMIMISLMVFSLSKDGKRFWGFFKDVKVEFKKIHFPKFPEVVNGFFVVIVFCSVAMALIWFLDGVFLNIYNLLMVKG